MPKPRTHAQRGVTLLRAGWCIALALVVVLIACGGASSKPPATTTTKSYVALGDSLASWSSYTTDCFAPACPFGYVKTFEALLESQEPGTDYVVTNLGRSCMPSTQLLLWITTGSFDDPDPEAAFCGHPLPDTEFVLAAIAQADVITFDTGTADLLRARDDCDGTPVSVPDLGSCLDAKLAPFLGDENTPGNWSQIVAELRAANATADIYTVDLYYPWIADDINTPMFDALDQRLIAMNGEIAMTAPSVPAGRVHLALNGASGEEDPVANGYLIPESVPHLSPAGADLVAGEICMASHGGGGSSLPNADGDSLADVCELGSDATP